MFDRNKEDFINRLKEMIRSSVSITDVIGRDVYLYKTGLSHKGLCPFHNDNKVGSFIVTESKQIFKCFSCGAGGDVIKYYSLKHNIGYVESMLKIGLEYGLITLSEYNQFSFDKTYSTKEEQKIKKYINKPVEIKNNKADDKILNKVYSLFIKGFKYLNKNVLTPEHKEHLLKERHLTEEEISERGYFTFPNKYILKYFFNDLENNNISLDILKQIPGFFFDHSKDSWNFISIKGGGIGIPVRNEKNEIIGIQVRKDVIKESEQRYIWFSSSFTETIEGLDYGSSSGSPIDVVIPKQIKSKTIFITEGHFKAQKIAKDYSSIALSVQGVCSWQSALDLVERIKRNYKNLNYVYIAYDGDMSYNTAVFKQAINMGISLYGLNHNSPKEEILKSLNDKNFIPKNRVYFCMWDDILGKGIDDLIFNGNADKIDKISLKKLYSLYNKYINDLDSIYIKSGQYDSFFSIEKAKRKELFDVLILSKLPKYQCV